MIKVENLSYSFPQKDLYNEISFSLEKGDHCAFIGESGNGKSTLIDLIINHEEYSYDGTLEISNDLRIGYMSQFIELDKTNTLSVFEYIAKESIKLKNELAAICLDMETSTNIDPLLENYQQTLDAFDAIGGEDFESMINKKLNLANLIKHKDNPISDLSGGEFKLIQVIKEMLNAPDLMIMDEPDVFLDFDNLNSLKNLINSHKGTLLVVTHNRYLLNHCFNKILHLENLDLLEFDGKYIEYNFSLLQDKIELQELAQNDTDELERNEVLIKRLRKAATEISDPSKGRALKSRVKLQERLEERRVKTPFVRIKPLNIDLKTDNKLEDTVALNVTDYNLAFDQVLLENVNFEINSNDKVAIIGPNGTGKTTLLREIYKNNNDSIDINKDIHMSYLSQVQGEMLDESNTVLKEFFDAGLNSSEEILSFIKDYGFKEESLNQNISSLSGGEKNLLQLAKISLSNANLLLLDEPTSHLDTFSQIALENAIKSYNGAILMISHDFYSIINCMDFVLLIDDKSIRKVNLKKFKKMIYSKHFNRDYMEIEEKKQLVEAKISMALNDNDFELAKTLSEDLESIVDLMS